MNMTFDIRVEMLDKGYTVRSGFVSREKYCDTPEAVNKEVARVLRDWKKDQED